MTYEEYLDEVTTLIFERCKVSEEDAIQQVMRAQAAGFFSQHDDVPEMRTQDRAERDAASVHEQYGKPSKPSKPRAQGAAKPGAPAKPAKRGK